MSALILLSVAWFFDLVKITLGSAVGFMLAITIMRAFGFEP